MSVKELNIQNFDETIKNSDKPVLVDFWAEWCGPCKMLSPVIHEIADEYGESLTVCSVNVDEEPELSSRFGVMSIPTLVMFKDGVESDKVIGVQSKEKI